MIAILSIVLGSIGTLAGAAAAIYTVRSARRLNDADAIKKEREADHQADINNAELRQELATEFNRRMELELKVGSLERRVARLEAQVRSLGHEPVNGVEH